jgi:protein-S-isoprenylcysteine O-methyltransferase Ste14
VAEGTAGRLFPLFGTALFLVAAPGVVALYVPYRVTRWAFAPPLLGLGATRAPGTLLALAGGILLVECFARFALQGGGTPAPVYPTERLVVTGAYRWVRNPMYVGVSAAILGQALLFGSAALLAYGLAVAGAFHAFVLLYEEPTLRARYGAEYDAYRANVRRWIPRLRPWRRP